MRHTQQYWYKKKAVDQVTSESVKGLRRYMWKFI